MSGQSAMLAREPATSGRDPGAVDGRLPPARRVLSGSLRISSLMRGTWGRGILLRGLVAAARRVPGGGTGEIDPLSCAHASLRAAARRPPRDPTQVNCGPLWLAALEMQPLVRDEGLASLAASYARHLAGPRVTRVRGAIGHLAWPASVWSDTAFMACPLLAMAGKETGRRELAREAVRQVLIHHELLLSGRLLRHTLWPGMAWLEDGALWARGNAWVLAAAAEVIDVLGPRETPDLIDVATSLARQIAGRVGPGGLLPVLLDDPSSGGESSGTALAARAILTLSRLGLAGEGMHEAGWRAGQAVMACVDAAGLVRRSQGPTIWASRTPVAGTWPWTQGLVLLLADEMAGSPGGASLW